MRRKVLAASVRGVIERLENRMLLSSTLSLAAGTGAISGVAYNDVNGNGVLDVGEPALPGASVTLQQVGVVYAPGTIPTVQADSNGAFSFIGLPAGQYDVNIIPDTGFVQDAPATFVATVSANDLINIDLGETNAGAGGSGTATISGTVFNDVTQQGIYTPVVNEFLAGDTVYLDTNGNGVFDPGEPSVVSNNVGAYSFTVAAGSYEVRVVPRPGFHQDPPGYSQVTAYSDESITANIGENNFATISGVVYQDLNGNGVQDPLEAGVSGETVFVDSNLDGTLEPGTFNPSTGLFDGGEAWTTTDANGHYVLTGLSPGNYRIIVASNSGMVSDGAGYSDVTVATGQDFVLNIGEGLPATISGTVFNDRNANGVLDPGEIGVPNQQVYLDVNGNGIFDATAGVGADGMPLAFPEPSAITDANGNFTITGVGPGTYTIRAVTPAGAIPTGPNNTTHSYAVTLLADQTLANQNFGFETPDLTLKFIKFPTTPALTDVPRRTTIRVTNVGSLPYAGGININLWAQTTNAPLDTTTASLVVTLPGESVRLGIGQSRLFKFVFSYPTQLPLDSYFITGQLNSTGADNNLANNVTAPIGPVQIGPPFIDIGMAYQDLPPRTVDPGQPTTIDMVVTNHGNVMTRGDLDFRVYLCQDASIEPTGVVVQDTILPHVRLLPNQSRLVRLTIPYPGSNINFKFINLIVSTDDPLGDGNQTNNIAIEASPTRFD